MNFMTAECSKRMETLNKSLGKVKYAQETSVWNTVGMKEASLKGSIRMGYG